MDRIAQVRLLELRNTYKWGGGPDKTILLSAERHNQQRVVTVVAYIRDVRDTEFSITAKARARGLTFYEIEEHSKFDWHVIRAIRDIVIRHDINVIHSHDYKSDLFAYIVRRWLCPRRIALLATAHGWALLGHRGNLYRRLDQRLMRHFDHLIAVSEATKNEMMVAGISPLAISVIHNAIDLDVWSLPHVTYDLRNELGLDDAFPVIGYVGRITPEKDLVTWLHAAALVVQKYPKSHFVLAGDGRDEVLLRELKQMAIELGISDRVTFRGYCEEPLAVYATLDLFMMSSVTEGLSNSLLEAMAMSLPVVTTDVGGTVELVENGISGFLVSKREPYALAQAVIALIGNDQLRRCIGQAARKRIEQKFSFANRLANVEQLYEYLLDSPSHRKYPIHPRSVASS